MTSYSYQVKTNFKKEKNQNLLAMLRVQVIKRIAIRNSAKKI
jgi:hypothetical protein